ncbi:MAG: vWA domain-containing protein [Candidatus Acidiferrales bacterium]
MLLDISGSMSGDTIPSPWDNAKDLVKAFLKQVSPRDWIALDVFGEREKEIVPFTHDFVSIPAAMDGLPRPSTKHAKEIYGTKTFAGDALANILGRLQQGMGFGDSVVFFSDGELTGNDADGSKASLNSMTTLAERRGVRLFLALASNRTPVQLRLDGLGSGYDSAYIVSDTAALMAKTGGATFEPVPLGPWGSERIYQSTSLSRRMAVLYGAIQGTYRTELRLEQSLPKKKRLHLTFVNKKGKAIHNVRLFYPEHLIPDSGAPR